MHIRFSTLLSCVASIPLAAILSGCAMTETASPTADIGVAIQGKVHGGQQPVVGAHVYLMAANTTGFSRSLELASTHRGRRYDWRLCYDSGGWKLLHHR